MFLRYWGNDEGGVQSRKGISEGGEFGVPPANDELLCTWLVVSEASDSRFGVRILPQS